MRDQKTINFTCSCTTLCTNCDPTAALIEAVTYLLEQRLKFVSSTQEYQQVQELSERLRKHRNGL